jgi:hypothetical protein
LGLFFVPAPENLDMLASSGPAINRVKGTYP